jgi:glycosyltransferase involved in cell wall biosynthesis
MTLPRIGIDGFNLALAHGTGVATYARTLAEAVRTLGHPLDLVYGLPVPRTSDPAARETLFYSALGEGRSGGEAPERITLRRAVRRLFLSPFPRDAVEVPIRGTVIGAGMEARLPRCDRLFTHHSLFYLATRHFRRYGSFLTVRVPDPPAIMHWTYPLPIRMAGAANLYTVHDLVPLRLPFASGEDKHYHHRLLARLAATADHLVTVSETSRRDIIDLFGLAPGRITNTYQAIEPPARDDDIAAGDARLRALFDLDPRGYLLFFGAIEPKKNVGRLIEAYLSAGCQTPLVLAGPAAWRADRELRLLDGAHGTALAGAARIRRIDYLPAEHLRLLLSRAKAVVFPSLYEGFGLPVAEAMAVGVPVIAGAAGALPEIAGKAALLVDPHDSEALARAIRRLDQDSALRTQLAQVGLSQAAQFLPEPYRIRLGALYARLVNARNGPSPADQTHAPIPCPNGETR